MVLLVLLQTGKSGITSIIAGKKKWCYWHNCRQAKVALLVLLQAGKSSITGIIAGKQKWYY